MKNKKYFFPVAIGVAILIVMEIILQWEGRLAICACGYVKLWHGAVISSQNSQHLFDWYSLTHVLHGLILYFLIWLADRKKQLSTITKLVIAIGFAAGWEVLENSSYVINRYRTETVSLDYYGDSIINAIGDVFSMSLGFIFALRTRIWMSIALFLVVETALAIVIRDNLAINIIMLIHPVEALKAWQQS